MTGPVLAHFMLAVALAAVAAIAAVIMAQPWWLGFWVAIIGALGVHREATNDWGQHVSHENVLEFIVTRIAYSLNPRNIDIAKLRDNWDEAIAWPAGSLFVVLVAWRGF